ncbi:RAQPRD family integrative conjugative element protein [Vibrio tritonius]|uniref:RAQPRD family integrative conjugative element protein n=1 Tax=Vibrio tritonius TaxID=1435069 RepID=A0ABS7YKC6_9VIBR|nr:RAQPRD family integrative conjugative element protein [Vibrio tritonius]MCA2014649.1 RAQPRD family integrative conjugative element protein [Vibrio tritonius]
MMTPAKTILLILSGIAVTASSVVYAQVWDEKALLQRYVEQLDALDHTLLKQAEMSADSNSRIRFNYLKAHRDLSTIVGNIRSYINKPLDVTHEADRSVAIKDRTTADE